MPLVETNTFVDARETGKTSLNILSVGLSSGQVNRVLEQISAQDIWALFLTGSIILLQLVKIEILDPSGGVLSSKVEFCLRRSIKFRFGGVQI